MNAVRYFFQILILFGAVLILNFSIIAQSTDNITDEKMPEKDLIHHGDLIDVDIIGSIEFDWRGTLTAEGNLDGLDFIEEPIFGLCKTVEEVEKSVAEGYSKLLREPKVKVLILDRSNRPLAVMFGAVRSEQRFQIKRPVLLNELIILSGGFTDKSSGVVQIFRPAGQTCIISEKINQNDAEERERFVRTSQSEGSTILNFAVTDLLSGKLNPQILSGDIITVLSANPIYVIGGVQNPKSFPSREKMTLSRAIASAGGFSKDAETDKITIFRQNKTSTEIIQADFEKIKAGSETDIVLQDFDIIEVGVKGREKNKFPPVIEKMDLSPKIISNLPLRIID